MKHLSIICLLLFTLLCCAACSSPAGGGTPPPAAEPQQDAPDEAAVQQPAPADNATAPPDDDAADDSGAPDALPEADPFFDDIPSPDGYQLSGGFGFYPDPQLEYENGHYQAFLEAQSQRLGYQLSDEQLRELLLAEYTLVIDGTLTLTLQQPFSAALTADFPFTPLETTEETLGQNADTFRGAVVRGLLFGNLKLETWQSPEAGATEWLYYLESNASQCQGLSVATPRGVRVGDTMETLLQAYPDATQVENSGYHQIYQHWPMMNPDYVGNCALYFWIENGAISKIELSNGLDGAPGPRLLFDGV